MPLRQQPQLVVELFDRMEVAVLVQDHEARIVYANRRAVELLDRKEEARMVGLTSFDPQWDVIRADGTPFPPEERPVASVIRTGTAVLGAVMGVRRPDSSQRAWLVVDAIPEFDGAGGVRYVVITLKDVTREHELTANLEHMRRELQGAIEQRARELADAEARLASTRAELARAQQELSAQERLYRSVFEVIGEGLVLHGPGGEIQAANPAAERILGLTQAQLTGREAIDPRWSLTAADGGPLPADAIPSEVTRTTGMPVRRRLLGVQRATGERAWLEVSTVAIGNARDRSGVVATFADVTAERLARLALERSEARFRKVTEAVPGVLFQLRQALPRGDGGGPALAFEFVSARTRELFGVEPEAVLASAEALLSRIDPGDRASGLRALADAGERGAAWEHTSRLAGHDRWIRARAHPEQREDHILWSGVILDVTEELRLEAQLRHSQRREAMGDLAAGVAHNFNNVLAVIVPNLEELGDVVPAEHSGLAVGALRAAHNAAEMVKQLLVTTRRELRRSPEAVDLGQLVREVAALCRQSFPRRIAVHVDVPDEPVVVSARASELHQVLLNLCLNARDAVADVEQPRLAIAVRVGESSVTLAVEDNGHGMSPGTVARLGEPFFTTKPVGEGTGLGLATAYAILRDLRAQVRVRTAPLAGTAFLIELDAPPAAAGAEASTAKSALSARPIPTALPPTPSRAILVIDDEELVRRAIARQLERLGYAAKLAHGARDGLAQLEREPFDAVVLDMSMPDMDGATVLREIRKQHPSLPVLIASGHVDVDVDIELGAVTAVLPKPVQRDGLADALRRMLG
jgi:PAS domain S-box-containing protein